MSGTLTIHEITFLESDVWEGDFPRDDIRTTTYDDLGASDAARIISSLGLTFASTGSDWASDPDGSYTSDYRTGERVETSAHLSEYPDRVASAIIDRVG